MIYVFMSSKWREKKKMFLVIDQRKSYMGVFFGAFIEKL